MGKEGIPLAGLIVTFDVGEGVKSRKYDNNFGFAVGGRKKNSRLQRTPRSSTGTHWTGEKLENVKELLKHGKTLLNRRTFEKSSLGLMCECVPFGSEA